MSLALAEPWVLLRIDLLGRPVLTSRRDGERTLKYRKSWALLAYLACHAGRWLDRDELAALLWPDLTREAARTNLRQVVADLRQALNDDPACAPLQVAAAQLRLDVLDGVMLDVAALVQGAMLPVSVLLDGHLLAPFLLGMNFPELQTFEVWLQTMRQQLAAQAEMLVERQSRLLRERGDLGAAVTLARQLHDANPLDETPLLYLLQLLLEQGEARAARQCYDAFAARCHKELGTAPGPAVQALLADMASEAVSVPPALGNDEVRTLAFLYAYPDATGDDRLSGAVLRDEVAGIVTAWEGSLVSTPGEGVMAVFGLGSATERLALRALRAAWALHQRGPQLRISVSCGRVHVQGRAPQLDLQGAAPDYALHMAWGAQPGTVVVCDNARQQVGEAMRFEAQPGTVSLPTRVEVRTHCLVGVPEPQALTRTAAEAPVGLVGRAAVMAALSAAWQQARQGSARIAVLQGRAGLGKTRLADELVRRVRADGGQVRRLGGRLEWRHQPLAPITGILTQLAGVEVGDGAATQRSKVASYLAEALPGLAAEHRDRLLELFASTADHAPAREAVFDAVIALIDTLLQTGPLLLVVDDLHWCDQTTLALLNHFIRSLADQPLLLLLGGRPGSCPPCPPARTQVHELLPLQSDEAAQLVAAHDPAGSLSADDCAHIAQLSGGIPLFIARLVKSRLEGHLQHHSINELLLAELSLLGSARGVLCAAAVWGQHFHLAQLKALQPEADVRGALHQALRQQLITRESEDRYAFVHVLIRDAAYDSLPATQQRQLHARCAAWLMQQAASPQAIAEHFERARQWAQAVEWWQRAGDTALSAEFAADAQQGFERALAVMEQQHADAALLLRVRMQLGRAAQMAEGFGSARAYEQFGIALAALEAQPVDSPGYRQQLFEALSGRYLGGGGREQGVLDGLDIAWRLVGLADSPAEQLMACYALGNSLFWRGRLHAARDWLERGIVLAASLDPAARTRYAPDDPAITCRAFLAWTLWFLGEDARATRVAADGIALARQGRRSHALCFMLTFASGVHWCRGDVNLVRRHSSEAQALAHQQGFLLWSSVNALFLQWVTARQGRLHDTAPIFAAAAAMQNAYDSGVTTARWIALHALLAQGGHHAAALPLIDHAIVEAEGNETGYCLADLFWLKADCLQAIGQRRPATTWRRRARELARRQQAKGLMARFGVA